MLQQNSPSQIFLTVRPCGLKMASENVGKLGSHCCKGLGLSLIILFLSTPLSFVQAKETLDPSKGQHLVIPILGTTLNQDWVPEGIVAEIHADFYERKDHDGLDIQFEQAPGHFSDLAKLSVTEAIAWVAEAANLNTDSWTVRFTLPYRGVTLYGESLSAMAALSVVAAAKHDPLHSDTVITGTVTSDGHIGAVGGVPLKITAAYKEHFRRVVIPEEQDVGDGDWHTPFLMQVSPLSSLSKAYWALTDHPLFSGSFTQPLSAGLVH